MNCDDPEIGCSLAFDGGSAHIELSWNVGFPCHRSCLASRLNDALLNNHPVLIGGEKYYVESVDYPIDDWAASSRHVDYVGEQRRIECAIRTQRFDLRRAPDPWRVRRAIL